MASKLNMIGDNIHEIAGKARVEETIPLKRPNPNYNAATDPADHEFEAYTEHRVYELETLTPEQMEAEERSEPEVWRLRGAYETHEEALAAATAIADKG